MDAEQYLKMLQMGYRPGDSTAAINGPDGRVQLNQPDGGSDSPAQPDVPVRGNLNAMALPAFTQGSASLSMPVEVGNTTFTPGAMVGRNENAMSVARNQQSPSMGVTFGNNPDNPSLSLSADRYTQGANMSFGKDNGGVGYSREASPGGKPLHMFHGDVPYTLGNDGRIIISGGVGVQDGQKPMYELSIGTMPAVKTPAPLSLPNAPPNVPLAGLPTDRPADVSYNNMRNVGTGVSAMMRYAPNGTRPNATGIVNYSGRF